ncbi:NADH:flavin oxidoreductase; NADH oxidase family protein [Candidatus Electrothrix aarhusensis]|uniref:NADH:flavin oxidoreductase n=1 Tax=Candidatus Electrothrix aarhusensis TaxID=1859131 RepID=A0A3S3UBW3_9BACT|nr:NADH:flavin oxidoreductase; NADH oxidase family protein [Candidatus Electrothrix aarhusensis]
METKQALLNDYSMGDMKLKNRVVMAPMTRSRADNPGNVATDLVAEYYARELRQA